MSDGRPCGATRRRDVPFCFAHDPASAQEAAEARRLGGLHRRRERVLAIVHDVTGVSTPEEQTRLVELGVSDILATAPSLKRGQSLFSAARTSARIRKEALMEARLRALEEAFSRRPSAMPRGSLLDDADRFGEALE
jgi:hypothetical protein